MRLSTIVRTIIIENDEGGIEIDAKMTEKTVTDTFSLREVGLVHVKRELEKINKKANRIGVKPLKLIVVSEKLQKDLKSDVGEPVMYKVYEVKIDGEAPIIDGYEFIASIEHSAAGNIINISPQSNVKELPAEFRTSNTDCDYCHTKRDRLNTFVLRETSTGKFKKVGRSCLKNFLSGKNPTAILDYASMLGKILNALVGGEEMEDSHSGDSRGSSNRYYDADRFLIYICSAYMLDGNRYISGAKAKESMGSTQSTGNFAMNLMFLPRGDKEGEKLRQVWPKAEALAEKISEWKDGKDWDAEIEKKPEMANYFHNMKVISNSSALQYKNAGYHASLLGMYLREKEWADKKAQSSTQKPKEYIGKIGEKISISAKLKKYKSWDGQWGTTHMYIFDEVGTENEVVWFASNEADMEEGETYQVTATVKNQQPSKFNQTPQTIITRAKIKPLGNSPATEPLRDQWGNALDARGKKIPNSKPAAT